MNNNLTISFYSSYCMYIFSTNFEHFGTLADPTQLSLSFIYFLHRVPTFYFWNIYWCRSWSSVRLFFRTEKSQSTKLQPLCDTVWPTLLHLQVVTFWFTICLVIVDHSKRKSHKCSRKFGHGHNCRGWICIRRCLCTRLWLDGNHADTYLR